MKAKALVRLLIAIAQISLLALTIGCSARRDIHQTLRENQFHAAQGEPMVLAAYQPWFGRPGHIDVGYSTHDRNVLEQQITHAKDLGISGFVVNWYGPSHQFEDRSYALLQEVASASQFRVALMYDEDSDHGEHTTRDTIQDLQYAYERYISPNSQANDSYLRYNGRPVIFIFPKGGSTDWRKVREAVNAWADPPVLLYKDVNQQYLNEFDGFYAWVHPGRKGWRPDGSNWGKQYLENFYNRMTAKYPDKIAVGAAWPGFDDRRASWSRNRRMSTRCGRTFEESLRLFRRYYDEQRPLPFLLIVTWNDYEEGTAIERGLETC